MVLYTKVVITATTITTTAIINTKRPDSKKLPNILSLQRTIPFQSQLKIHIHVYVYVYKCIYIIYTIYTYTVYPLIGIEFPSEGQETGGAPFCTIFQKSSLLLNVPPLFSLDKN